MERDLESEVNELIACGRFFYAGKEHTRALECYEQALELCESRDLGGSARCQELYCQCGRALQWLWMTTADEVFFDEMEAAYKKALALVPHGYNYFESLINMAFAYFQQRQDLKSNWSVYALNYAMSFYTEYLLYPAAYLNVQKNITIYGDERADLVWAFGVIVDILYHSQTLKALPAETQQWCVQPDTIKTIRMMLSHHPLKKMYIEMFDELLLDLMNS